VSRTDKLNYCIFCRKYSEESFNLSGGGSMTADNLDVHKIQGSICILNRLSNTPVEGIQREQLEAEDHFHRAERTSIYVEKLYTTWRK
jgi:hypothetical protein